MKNIFDDMIMDKFDKVIKIGVILISLVLVGMNLFGTVKENIPRVQDMVNTYKEGKELLEVLPEKEQKFNNYDVTYGYIASLMGIPKENVQIVCDEDEIKSLDSIASALKFNTFTTEEELEQMKNKEYAIKRFGLSNYTTIHNIVEAHK